MVESARHSYLKEFKQTHWKIILKVSECDRLPELHIQNFLVIKDLKRSKPLPQSLLRLGNHTSFSPSVDAHGQPIFRQWLGFNLSYAKPNWPPSINPDFYSSLIYRWGYCNLSISSIIHLGTFHCFSDTPNGYYGSLGPNISQINPLTKERFTPPNPQEESTPGSYHSTSTRRDSEAILQEQQLNPSENMTIFISQFHNLVRKFLSVFLPYPMTKYMELQ